MENKGKIGPKKVAVALSGGVDSAVSAALLKEAGYEVFGVFIKTWHPDFLPCTWREERHDAMRVCAHLSIPFETLDLSEAYKQNVADYFIGEYKAGRTPNPDVMCNKYIKFGAFIDATEKLGCDAFATGHYARVLPAEETREALNIKPQIPKYRLLAGVDKNKDQSYFLWTLTQDILSRTYFPIGHLTKNEVREIARVKGIPVAEKKDSQGVCFLGELEMREFLKHFIPAQSGDVLDPVGAVIGSHEGAFFYTVGQRHGFDVRAQSPTDRPRYVAEKNVAQNTITVSEEYPVSPLYARESATLTDTHWIGEVPREGVTYTARFRYRQSLERCTITLQSDGNAEVLFGTSQRGMNPGQSLVLYDNEVCLGGGIIRGTDPADALAGN